MIKAAKIVYLIGYLLFIGEGFSGTCHGKVKKEFIQSAVRGFRACRGNGNESVKPTPEGPKDCSYLCKPVYSEGSFGKGDGTAAADFTDCLGPYSILPVHLPDALFFLNRDSIYWSVDVLVEIDAL